MTNNLIYIRELLQRHQTETAEGLVDKSPSQLLRGEGTEKNFYIMKIDLVGSTELLLGRKKSTYLKLAHTFLSTVDKITQNFGADPNQVEYAGDSVLAYFAENQSSAEDVITAACYSRAAVQQIKNLEGVLNTLQLNCKVVLHFDTLMIAKIGPRANSILSAIGHPIHRVAKIEKEIPADTGRTTEKFFQQVSNKNRRFLYPAYKETQAPVTGLTSPAVNSLRGLLYPFQDTILQPKPRSERILIGYDLRWNMLFKDLNLV
jgi:class 3 adenylate cyclase